MRGLAVGLPAIVFATCAIAAPISYTAPPETARLAAGPDANLAQAYCAACHSVDYITTQPRALAAPTVFWTNEVNKMKKAYGARLDDDASRRIVAYLAATYGK
jgi:cytochrome c553